MKVVLDLSCNTISLKLFNQNVKETKISFEGLDLTGFTHLIRTDRDFMIDILYHNYFSEEKVQRRKEVEDYKQLVGKQDYYYPAKS